MNNSINTQAIQKMKDTFHVLSTSGNMFLFVSASPFPESWVEYDKVTDNKWYQNYKDELHATIK